MSRLLCWAARRTGKHYLHFLMPRLTIVKYTTDEKEYYCPFCDWDGE